MEIQNEALRRMFEEAKKSRASTSNSIPVVEEEIQLPQVITNNKEIATLTNLSLDLNEAVDRSILMSNVAVEPRQLTVNQEDMAKARRKVGRLTTGASAAVPLICRGASCPFKAKCLPGYTKISTPNGFKLLEEMYVGDLVYSINDEGYIETDTVIKFINSGLKTIYTVSTKYGLQLDVTSDHLLLTCDENYEKIYKSIETGLDVGSTVFIIDPELELNVVTNSYGDTFEDTITSIKEKGKEKVYDITVEDNHNFFANNILVHNCHYYAINAHEVGEDCLVEEQLIEYWTQKYLDELAIDYNSISEMHFLSRLVEIDIMNLRMTNYISINDQDLMMDFISSVDPNGAPLSNKGTSVAFEIKERLEKQKIKILESLNSTRDKKSKLEIQGKTAENAHSQKSLFEKLDRLTSNLISVRDVNNGSTIINI